jgi:hypothetical protein
VYLFMLRRWAHNSTYTDVANPHNCINDVPLAAGTPVIVDGVVDVHLDIMTEAHRDSRNCKTTSVHCFIGFVYSL